MPDKRTQQRIDRMADALEQAKTDRDEARADLNAVKEGISKMLECPDVGPEELAVGLALVGAIVRTWPHVYTPHTPGLAASARVEPAVVEVALDTFRECGAIHPGVE